MMTFEQLAKLLSRLGVEVGPPPQWEGVEKAASLEEAIREDRQFDIITAAGWTKVEIDDATGELLSPVLFRDPEDPTNILSGDAAYFVALRRRSM